MLLAAPPSALAGPQATSNRCTAARCRPSAPSRRRRLSAAAAAGGDDGGAPEPGLSGRDEADAPTAAAAPRKQMPYRAIGALAAVGLADSAYLTAVKLLGVAPACPVGGLAGGGCGDVLDSSYATLFGVVPLAAVGMAAYAGVAVAALAGARAAAAGDAAGEGPARAVVLAGGAAMATCSALLLRLLLTEFAGSLCPWCLASAACSLGIAAAAASGLRPGELRAAAAPGAGAAAATLALLSLGLGTPDLSFAAGGYDLDYALPAVTTQSSPQAVSLAQRLRDGGARMYGAFWCSHCHDQKLAFGEQAMAAFPYVECYPDGLHKDTKLAPVCEAAPGGLQGFPTWVIGGEQLVGEQSFEQLEAALARAAAAAPAPAPAPAG